MQHSLLHCVQSPSPLLAVLTHSHIITALPTASTSHNQYPCLEITTKKVCLTIVALPRSHAAVSHEDTWAAGYWLDTGYWNVKLITKHGSGHITLQCIVLYERFEHIPPVCAVKIFLQGRTMEVSHHSLVIIQFSLQPSMLDPGLVTPHSV